MRGFRTLKTPRRIVPGWITLLAGAICAYTLALLWNFSESQAELRDSIAGRLIDESQGRVDALVADKQHFVREAQALAKSGEIQSYLANKALGMSMQYGLAASLSAIDLRLSRALQEREGAYGLRVSGLVFLDEDLSELSRAGLQRPPHPGVTGLWHAHETRFAADVHSRQLIVTIPVRFKESLGGWLMAVAELDQLSRSLPTRAPAAGKGDIELLVADDGTIVTKAAAAPAISTGVSRALASGPAGSMQPPTDSAMEGEIGNRLVLRTAVAGMPLSLVVLADRAVLRANPASQAIFYTFATLPLLLLGYSFAYERQQRQKVTLERHNAALSGEIERREALEKELRLRAEQLTRLGEDLRATARRAEAANHAKSEFLAMMSHEIRTPMNGILGMAQVLMSPGISQEQQSDCVRTILSSGSAMLTLLNDILDLSKVEAGKMELNAGPIRPAAVAREVAALFQQAAVA